MTRCPPVAHHPGMPHGRGARGLTPEVEGKGGGRDLDFEARFLADATTGLDGWPGHVAERLAQGERDYGNGWAARSAADLAGEAVEECADVGGWTALATQALEVERLGDDDRAAVVLLLGEAATLGARAHALLAAAIVLLDGEGGR